MKTAASTKIPDGRDCLCGNVQRLSRIAKRLYDTALRPHGLDSDVMAYLWAIGTPPQCCVGDVAERLGAEASTASRMTKRLAERGLIRVDEGHDQRSKSVTLTPAGRQLLKRGLPSWREAQAKVREALGGTIAMEGFNRSVRKLSRRLL